MVDVRAGLSSHFLRGREDVAAETVRRYLEPSASDQVDPAARFDDFDPSGTKAESSDVFTADDVVAAGFVSPGLTAAAAFRLLESDRERFTELLTWIGPDRDLVDEDSPDPHHFVAAWETVRRLRDLPGLDACTASALLARKRPRLLPVMDTPLNKHHLGGIGISWATVHHALRADGHELQHRLLDIRTRAGLDEQVSVLRLLDVLV